MLLASGSTQNFYDSAINIDIPDDAIEISEEHHTELLNGQAEGKIICWDKDGYPFLADPPPPTAEQLAVIERNWRDAQLLSTDPLVSRHRDELEEGSETTLLPAQYSELQAYRRALRNWPENGEFPLAEHRPVSPPWLSAELQ